LLRAAHALPESTSIPTVAETESLGLGELMRFTLTYDGPLLATGNDPPVQSESKLRNIWAIRNRFEPQIGRIYETNPIFRGAVGPPSRAAATIMRSPIERNGFKFAAIARTALGLGCEVDIKLLVNHEPGSVITRAGDLDNRLKTIFDALRVPQANEFRGINLTIAADHFYPCLLEDDAAITKVSIASERWLDGGNRTENEVHLSIGVRVIILTPMFSNAPFAVD
jgi:hypothetical protein